MGGAAGQSRMKERRAGLTFLSPTFPTETNPTFYLPLTVEIEWPVGPTDHKEYRTVGEALVGPYPYYFKVRRRVGEKQSETFC